MKKLNGQSNQILAPFFMQNKRMHAKFTGNMWNMYSGEEHELREKILVKSTKHSF